MNRTELSVRLLLLVLPLASAASGRQQVSESPVDLSPTLWEDGEYARLEKLQVRLGEVKPIAHGSSGLVSGTSSILAVRSGLEALRQGGTAADAAITVALDQVALTACGKDQA